MSKTIEFTFCELPETPREFNIEKFKAHDPVQIKLYNDSKAPRRKKVLTYEALRIDEGDGPNYARVVPDDCVFIDYDNATEAAEMYEIILRSKLKCLILETVKGYHFLFRKPDFYKKEMTRATNWFGYTFDTKGPGSVQIIKVCGMERDERASWRPGELIAPKVINIEDLDILPYWLWGKLKDTELHKGGKTGDRSKEDAVTYTLKDNPFTTLMKMTEGSRHNYIVERCSYFGLSNGFEVNEFKNLIQAIHDQYLVKIGTAMSDSDLFGDLPKRWEDYGAMLSSEGWDYDEKERKWTKAKSKKNDKIDERRAAEYVYSQFDFYGAGAGDDGLFKKLFYKEIDGPFEYKTDLTVPRQALKDHSDQNFKDTFFKEVEVQLMQMCAANNKRISRTDMYIIVKNKILNCFNDEAYDFSWLGTRPPTDVVLNWNWYPREWVEEHEEDLGGQINWFLSQLSRNARGVEQPYVVDWLWVIAGASMIPANRLQKIVVLAGGGQNGKSLYTSLIRLCLGEDMWNESKIFDSNPQEKFWGEDFDKGILCVIDDLVQNYNRQAFTTLKGAITGTDSVWINEKFKPKKRLDVIPQIIACTNFEFELYDKTDGMKRRVKILPTEYHIDDSVKDADLQHKLVLNVKTREEVMEYRMKESAFGNRGVLVMNMHTKESGVLQSMIDGPLAWFANKARYMYMDWVAGKLVLKDTDDMKERFADTFAGGFDAELEEFLEWYITERKEDIWTKELYLEYQDWHAEMATGDVEMKEKAFSMKLGKTIDKLVAKGYKLEMRKTRNDKGMSINRLFIGEKEEKSE